MMIRGDSSRLGRVAEFNSDYDIYGTMYGMVRTTVYMPKSLKADLERVARSAGRSEAELIREGVRALVERHTPPEPRIPLFNSNDPNLAEHADELLEGFGVR